MTNFSTNITGEGFSAVWRSIDTSACPAQIITAKEGTLLSPNFPNFLLQNLNCTYTIQASIGRKVLIEFISYDIQNDATVFVDMGQGLLQPFQLENLADGIFMSHGEKVQIALVTGENPEGRGFKVSFKIGILDNGEL